MTRVWFIRHAESEYNAGLTTLNPTKVSLTDRGLVQAKSIEQAFVEPPTLLVTSPYLRTKQTAEPTIERFRRIRQEEWRVEEFTYFIDSRYENMTPTQIKLMAEAFWNKCDPFYIDGEGAESFSIFIDRVQATLNKLKCSKNDFVAIYTHGRFIQAVLWLLLNRETQVDPESMKMFKRFAFSFQVPNASILKIEFINSEKTKMSDFIVSHLAAVV